jgi:hypothetical protein
VLTHVPDLAGRPDVRTVGVSAVDGNCVVDDAVRNIGHDVHRPRQRAPDSIAVTEVDAEHFLEHFLTVLES